MVRIGLTFSRLAIPAARCPTRPLMARYLSVDRAAKRCVRSRTAMARAMTSSIGAPLSAAWAAANTMNPWLIDRTRESTTLISRSSTISRAATAAAYVALISPLTQKQITDSAPCSKADW